MQIIAGKWKRKKLITPKDNAVRPTQQRIKEVVFNILQTEIQDARFLDLCAGSGGMGIEALSRGAKTVMFIDQDCQYLRRNLEGVQTEKGSTKILEADCSEVMGHIEKSWDVIFLDPPWGDLDLYRDTLLGIFESDILSPEGILIIEHKKKASIKDLLPQGQIREVAHGRSALTILRNT